MKFLTALGEARAHHREADKEAARGDGGGGGLRGAMQRSCNMPGEDIPTLRVP